MSELALEQTLDLGDYMAAFRRRRGMMLLVAGVIFTIGTTIAVLLPPTYQSTATILIEEQEIPRELIQSTVTSYAAQRIQIISQRVMARSNLMEIIKKYDLYKKERKNSTTDQVLAEMRRNIGVEMVTAEVVDPRTGRPSVATIAFSLGFKSASPQQAQKVASELTTLYLNENLKSRTEKAAETYDFLTTEAGRLKDEISTLEEKLSDFKGENLYALPESRSLNTQSLQRAETELANIDIQIQSMQERRIHLQGQLPLLDPYASSAISPAARLNALRTQYISLASRYSPDHPDVTRLKHEIEALEEETGNYGSPTGQQAQLELLRQELAMAEQLYTADHPDVTSLKHQIAAMESGLRDSQSANDKGAASIEADNPAYINLQIQLATADSGLKSLHTRRANTLAKIEEYEERLLQTPKIEQAYRMIARDLDQASSRYQATRQKQRTAEIGQSMEKERKGEKFTLIDPAVLPQEPISPNRPAFIFLSLVLALGAGVGTVAVAESMNAAVRGAKGVAAVLHTAPLAIIPYLPNETDTRAQEKKKKIFLFSVIAVFIILILLVHFLFSPLDILWFKSIRKVDKILGE